MADLLQAHGIRSGHAVALHGRPSFTLLWCIFALWSIGAQVLVLEAGISAAERREMMPRCAPQFLVNVGGLNLGRETFVSECEVLVRRLPGGRPAQSDHCLVQFSSATTGQAKAIGRTPESLNGELERLGALPGMPRAGERVAVLGSAVHSFGLIGGVLHAMDAGVTVLFPADQTPLAVADAAMRADVLLGAPRHFAQLAALDAVELPRLRLAVSGGEVLTQAVAEAFCRRYGVRIGQAYGTTETGIIAADLAGKYDPPIVGTPVAGIQTRLHDGVLEVYLPQSPYLCQREPRIGGWISTHDLARVEPVSGALRLRGRVADGGRTEIDLLQVESVLGAHAGVTEAVVVGGDPIEAHVAGGTDLDQAQLSLWCRQFLSESSVPVSYHIVPELLRTANGKVRRRRIQPGERLENQSRSGRRRWGDASGELRAALH